MIRTILRRNPYLFTLLLLAVAVGVNWYLQPNLFEPRPLSGNFRTFLPLIVLAAGQTIVVIAGGIDLSVGAIVSLAAAILVTQLAPDAPPAAFVSIVALAGLAGVAAGAVNGFCVTVLRLQPIVTTYATSFIFGGLALTILPRPGGAMPEEIARFYRREMPLGLPVGVYVIIAVILLWLLLRQTRYGRYLFAVGGQPEAAYASGVPVNVVRFTSYMISGLMAAMAAVVLTLNTGSAGLGGSGGAGRHPAQRWAGRNCRNCARGHRAGAGAQHHLLCQCAHVVADPHRCPDHCRGAGHARTFAAVAPEVRS
jgi:ribose transport system permease protein